MCLKAGFFEGWAPTCCSLAIAALVLKVNMALALLLCLRRLLPLLLLGGVSETRGASERSSCCLSIRSASWGCRSRCPGTCYACWLGPAASCLEGVSSHCITR